MQVWASVNEADIGGIRAGQPVTFTVDAFPGEKFTGTVEKIRLNATMSQNVVTYVVEVVTDNSSMRLLPYLSANLNFEVERKNKALSVPNAAIRFSPDSNFIAEGETISEEDDYVWVKSDEDKIRPIKVRVVLSDGAWTAIESPEIKDGMEIVTAAEKLDASNKNSASNPFMPKVPQRKKANSAPKKS